MDTKSHYESEMLEELQELPEEEKARLLLLIRFLKEELGIFPSSTPTSAQRSALNEKEKAAILQHAGLLADLTPEEEKRFADSIRRRPLFGNHPVCL